MSWQDYVDNQLLASRCVSKAAIAGHDGGVWAKSDGFEVNTNTHCHITAWDCQEDALGEGLLAWKIPLENCPPFAPHPPSHVLNRSEGDPLLLSNPKISPKVMCEVEKWVVPKWESVSPGDGEMSRHKFKGVTSLLAHFAGFIGLHATQAHPNITHRHP